MFTQYDYKPYIPKQIISIDLKISNTYSKNINIKQIMENGWLGWETPLYANSIIFEDTSLKIYSCIKKLIIEFHKENIKVKCKCNIGSYYIFSISPYIYRIQIINSIRPTHRIEYYPIHHKYRIDTNNNLIQSIRDNTIHHENNIQHRRNNIKRYNSNSIPYSVIQSPMFTKSSIAQNMDYFNIKKINMIKTTNTIIIESIVQCTEIVNNTKNISNICKKIKRKAYSEYINLLYKYISANLLYIIIEFI